MSVTPFIFFSRSLTSIKPISGGILPEHDEYFLVPELLDQHLKHLALLLQALLINFEVLVVKEHNLSVLLDQSSVVPEE
jgi:hypothetical protein